MLENKECYPIHQIALEVRGPTKFQEPPKHKMRKQAAWSCCWPPQKTALALPSLCLPNVLRPIQVRHILLSANDPRGPLDETENNSKQSKAKLPIGHWKNVDNHRELLDRIGKELGVEKVRLLGFQIFTKLNWLPFSYQIGRQYQKMRSSDSGVGISLSTTHLSVRL